MWETKLIKYQRWKEQLTAIIESEREGLSLETVARIKNLEFIKQHLETKDEWGQLGNAIGILNAYRSGDLAWAHGLVTYWSDGKCLVEHPIPFEWDDVDKYKAICGDGALWVEGVSLFCFRWSIPNRFANLDFQCLAKWSRTLASIRL